MIFLGPGNLRSGQCPDHSDIPRRRTAPPARGGPSAGAGSNEWQALGLLVLSHKSQALHLTVLGD